MSAVAEVLAPVPAGPRAVRRRNAFLVTLGGLGLIGALLTIVRTALDDPPPKGPTGSSFATSAGGVGAFAELAAKAGVTVERLTEAPSKVQSRLYVGSPIIVVLGTELDADDRAAILGAVRSGSRVVADITPGNHWITDTVQGMGWQFGEYGHEPASAAASLAGGGAQRLDVLALGSFTNVDPRETERIWGVRPEHESLANHAGSSIAERLHVGQGEIIALADASMLSNQLLGEKDNAAFALALLGDGKRVVFAEHGHGYGKASVSPTGLPWRAKWFIGGLFFATLCLMWSRSRRNGPPESAERELGPARSDYLHSMVAAIDAIDRRRFTKRTSTNSSVQRSIQPSPRDE